MKKTKVIIIDDEQLARNIVREYLLALPNYEVVAECSNGFEGLKAIIQFKPDLIFLDIQMPKISGFEMLELMEEMPGIIFATAFEEYAISAFEKNAIDYLLKPFSQDRFNVALQKWESTGRSVSNLQALQTTERTVEKIDKIVTRIGTEVKIIALHTVCYLEAKDDYVKIVTEDLTFLKKKTMLYFETVLPAAQFFRVHRSYLLNLSQLTALEPYEKNTYLAILKNGKRIPVSRSGYARLKETLGW